MIMTVDDHNSIRHYICRSPNTLSLCLVRNEYGKGMKEMFVQPIGQLCGHVGGNYICFVSSSGWHICLPLLYCSLGDAKKRRTRKKSKENKLIQSSQKIYVNMKVYIFQTNWHRIASAIHQIKHNCFCLFWFIN